MQNRYRRGIALILFFLLAQFSVSTLAETSLPKGIMKLDGRAAPTLILKNMDGEQFDLTNSKGRWVFVHFWAAWCGPCRKEMPKIQTIFSQLDQDKLEIVLVNTAESEDIVFSFIAGVASDLNPLMDTNGLVTEQWQPRGLPATFFVDPKGKLQYLALGGRDWEQAEYLNFLKKLTQ